MYLTRDERRRAIEAAVEEASGHIPVVAGIGALRTDDAVKLAQDAKPLAHQPVLFRPLPTRPYRRRGIRAFQGDSGRERPSHRLVAIKNPGWKTDDTARHLAEQRAIVPDGFSIGCSGDWLATETMIAGADTWYRRSCRAVPKSLPQDRQSCTKGDAAPGTPARCRTGADLGFVQAVFQPARRLCIGRNSRRLPR